MKCSAVDFFCGIGGLTHGLQLAGIKVVAGIDSDESCKYAYEENNRARFIHSSIDDVHYQDIISLFKSGYKILVGCAPCQPFSRHIKDKKNRNRNDKWGLLYSFLNQIEKVKPEIVSMENVPQLAKEVVFKDFVSYLENMGYHVTYRTVNAANYGVPQRRTRLLLLASLLGDINFIPPTHTKKHITVRRAIGNLPPLQSGEVSDGDLLHRASKLFPINIQRLQHSVPGGTWRDWPDYLVPECFTKKSGESYSAVYGRMEWDAVSPTLTTQFHLYGTGRYGHPDQNRAISLREGALLQSFPQKYKFIDPLSKIKPTYIARQIGNAVPVKLAKMIGKSIMNHLKERETNGQPS